MRSLVSLLIGLLYLTCLYANDLDISTSSDKGGTVFYLQAGIFTDEKSAQNYLTQLSQQLGQPIRIKKIADKNLYMVQVGPIQDYPVAREVKDKLKQLADKEKGSLIQSPLMSDSSAQPKHPPKIKKKESKLWNLRNADIRAVISEISRVTGKNFVIDPRVQGKISIVSSNPINNDELYQVFLSMLQVSGYAAIPSGEVIKIVPNIDAKTQISDQLDASHRPPVGDDVMVEVLPVHYVPAEQLVPVLRPLMPQWSSVSAYSPSNMLILSGRANNIHKLASIIKQVDSSNANGIDMVPLRYALAMDVVNSLKEIIKPQPGSNSHVQISLSADDRSNSILISGNKTDRLRIRILINKLDKRPTGAGNSNTQVIYLNYMRAEDLAPILAGVAQANFSGNVGTTIGTITHPELDSTNPAASMATTSSSANSEFGSSPSSSFQPAPNNGQTANTTGSTTQTEGSTKPTVQIIAEPNTNSIIVNGPAALIRILKSVTSQLDIKPAQILIEALVAEVDENYINDLGIEWGSDLQTGDPKKFRNGFAILNSKTNLSDFQAQIYALAQDRRANILSTPSVVVLDNRQAKIQVGKQVSVASTSYPNNAGGTTTASPYTTFDRVNVTLHLYVRPQITRGEGIQMQIDQGNNTLDPSVTPDTLNPTFKISSIVTSVHVESGDIVVLGGLTQASLGNDDNHIPILGDIPGLGKMFQRNITNREKKVLIVFIKPKILRNERDAIDESNGKYNNVRQFQLEYMRSQDQYNPHDMDSVLSPLKQAKLPTPFTNQAQAAKFKDK